ncbi:MAG TPA: DUF1499 domain-containing protein [Candidatus Binataceae bacterium]|nr:DUF1499 domain-containing protein [Candidatus Binataceae bacterium]
MVPAWLAFFDGMLAVTLVLVGIIGAHFYFTPPFFGFQLFLFGFLLSVLGLILGLLGLLMTRSPARRSVRPRALIGTVLSLVIAVPIFAMLTQRGKVPAINDITTDFENPPEYVHAVELAPNQGRDMKYNRDKYMAAQQKGYPPLGPATVAADPAAVFERVKTVATSIPDWQTTYEDPKTMTLEGVSTSHLFHFQDDFVIQVRPGPNGTSLVEMRSKSRDGIGDFGVNYKRIVMFFDKLQAAG